MPSIGYVHFGSQRRQFGIAQATTAPLVSPIARIDAVPPQAYFVGSSVFHYLGPSFAVLLFARVDVLGVAWLRIGSAALVFALWRRPWRKFLALDRHGQTLIVALGAVFAVMNACFYISIDRLPLATVAAIEFIGPIALALIGARIGRNVAAVVAAGAGVYLLTQVHFVGEPVGVAFAFANAALFTAYIILAHRVARRSAMGGVDGLAAAMLCAFVFVSPIGLSGAAHAFSDPIALAAGIGVGVSSSVIPYVFDQLAMVRLPRATYALFVALLPATATVIGVIVLHQLPSPVELAGIALVMVGVGLHRAEPVATQRSHSADVRTLGRSSPRWRPPAADAPGPPIAKEGT
jgi:inner membrane transporter RhtA